MFRRIAGLLLLGWFPVSMLLVAMLFVVNAIGVGPTVVTICLIVAVATSFWLGSRLLDKDV